MSVFIWGSKGFADHLGYVIQECPFCRNPSPFAVYEIGRKFTVYWIPTFSYGKKLVAECGVCRGSFEVAESCRERLATALLTQQQLSDLLSGKSPIRSSQRYDRPSQVESTVVVVEPPPKNNRTLTPEEQQAGQRGFRNDDTAAVAPVVSPELDPSVPAQAHPQEITSKSPVEDQIAAAEPTTDELLPKMQKAPARIVKPESGQLALQKADAVPISRLAMAFPCLMVVCLAVLIAVDHYANSARGNPANHSELNPLAALEPTLGNSDEVPLGSSPIEDIVPATAAPLQQTPEVRSKLPTSTTEKETALLSYTYPERQSFDKFYRDRSDELTDAGNRLALAKRYREAIEKYRSAIRHDPGNYRPKCNLARIFATCPDSKYRDGKVAIRYASEAANLVPHSDWQVWSVVAASYAESGDFALAIEWGEKACIIAQGADLQNAQVNLRKYQSHLAVTW